MIEAGGGKAVQEAGKGLQEVAKGIDKSTEAVEKLGALVDRTFGSVISNAIGLVSDRLAYYRLEKAIELSDNVEKKLKARGIDKTRYVPVNFGLPLLEKATVEEDPSLAEKWVNLLANARDPNQLSPHRSFVTILAEMEPLDARVLDTIIPHKKPNTAIFLDKLTAHLKLPARDVEISVRNLFRLGLVKPGVMRASGALVGGEPITIYKDLNMFEVTEMAVDFHKAVSS